MPGNPGLNCGVIMLAILLFAAQAHAQGILIGVTPELPDASPDVYMQIGAASTGSSGFAPGTYYFEPHAVESDLGKAYSEVCIYVAVAGTTGSTIDIVLHSGNTPAGLEWTGQVANDAVGEQCAAFVAGTWEAGSPLNDGSDDLRLDLLEVAWFGFKKSAGATSNNLRTVSASSARSLGAAPNLIGAPTTGLSISEGDYADPIDAADLARTTGQALLVGLR